MINQKEGIKLTDRCLIIPRGLGKSRFVALAEIDFLYRTGRLTFEDYLDFTGEALIRLFGQSEEFVEKWKERAREDEQKKRDAEASEGSSEVEQREIQGESPES